MLNSPSLDKLREMKLSGMVKGLEEQLSSNQFEPLDFEERLGLLIDREAVERDNRRLATRLRQAKLRYQACMEDVEYSTKRGLDRSLMSSLSTCKWIKDGLNVLIAGPTGVGKSYIACALAHKACLQGYKVRYFRTPRLFQEFRMAHGDGTYHKLLNSIAKTNLLVVDDWGLKRLTDMERNDLLEILEDRHGCDSTIITSQVPIEDWHDVIGNPTLADAILDRIVHNSYSINLKGESMRKIKAKSK